MKKIICFALAIATVLCVLASCGAAEPTVDTTASAPAEETTAAEKTVVKESLDMDAVLNKIIADTGVTDPLILPGESLCDLYGIIPADIDGSSAYATMDGVFPDEVVIIKAMSEEGAARIAELLNTHLNDVVNQASNYDAESFAKLQKCEVATYGLYVTMFISQNCEQMKTIFEEA